jgi:MFS family permease
VAWLVHAFAEEPPRGVAEGKARGEDGHDAGARDDDHGDAAVGDATVGGGDANASFAEEGDPNARVTISRLALDFARKSRSVVSRRTNVLGFLQGVPGCVPWSIISVFMNDYLAVDKGLGVEAATSLLMCFGLGAMGGTVGGGVVGQRLYNASPRYATSFMGAAAVAGIFPWLFLVHADDYDSRDAAAMARKCAVAVCAGLLCSVTGVNVRAMTVNVNDPRERGTAFAWFNLTDDLGKGFGPVLIAALIGRMGRQKAFELGFWFWVPCGALCALCGLTVPADEARVRRETEARRRRSGEGEAAALLGKGGDKMV